jgi:DNA-binding transcriptional LysR family regulator
MHIESLRFFITAAEFGNFSKAAEHLYTTQPNISRHVKRLEAELGVKLFIRNANYAKLTNAGEKVFVELKEIVMKFDQLKNYTNNLSENGKSNKLRIGYNGFFVTEQLFNIIKNFRLKHPNIEISFAKINSDLDLLNALNEDKLDVIFSTAAIDSNELNGICYKEIIPNEFVLVFPEGHRFKNYNLVKKEDLRGEPILLIPREICPHYYDWITKFVKGNTIIFVSDIETLMLEIASGKGLAILARLLRIPETLHFSNFEYDRNEINANLILSWKKVNYNPSISLFTRTATKQHATKE